MTRLSTAAGLILAIALAPGGCSDSNGDGGGFAGSASGAGPAYGGCHQYTSCASCTPVVGCGWCYLGNGTGKCAFDPDECDATAFSWTWEPTGCHVTADASVNGIDAGPQAPEAGSSAIDAGSPGIDAAHDAAADATNGAADAVPPSGDATSEAAPLVPDAAAEASIDADVSE